MEYPEFAERAAPYSAEAEMAVLGASLLDQEALELVLEKLRTEDFYREGNRRCFAAMQRIHRRGDALDAVTLSEELRSAGDLEAVGGLQFLASILDAVPTAANIAYHVAIVADKARLRRLISALTGLVQECYQPGASGEAMLLRTESVLSGTVAAEDRGDGNAPLVKDLLWGRMEAIEERTKSDRDVTGLSSGIAELDGYTAGFQNGDLIIVAARPSQGKTAFVLGVVAHAAITAGKTATFFSLEMSKESLVDRLLVSESRVDGSRVRTGRLRDDDYPRLATAAGLLNTCRIRIDDTPALSIHDLRARAHRIAREEPDLGLIVVDYLQLMSGGGNGKGENRQQEVSEISRGLKALARALNVPVVALSQLSRAVEQRPDKRPILSDLRDSGGIEQDADVVAFLYRPEYYYGPTDKDGNSLEGKAEIIIGKQRNGPTGSVPAVFHKSFMRFEGYAARPGDGGRDNPAWTQR